MRYLVPLVVALSLACAGADDVSSTPPVPEAPAGGPVATSASAVDANGVPTDMPYYSTRALSDGDLQGKSLKELSLMRNTIYARVGNPFKKQWLHDYFSAQPWYRPLDKADLSKLTDVDKQNAATIGAFEAGLSRDELLRRKDALLASADPDPVERELLSGALGEYVGDAAVPAADRNPLEDPSVLDQALRPEQIADMSLRDLRILRNTIFARHGRAFQSQDLQEYFGAKAWYKVDSGYTDDRLTDVDRQNVTLIKKQEDEMKSWDEAQGPEVFAGA